MSATTAFVNVRATLSRCSEDRSPELSFKRELDSLLTAPPTHDPEIEKALKGYAFDPPHQAVLIPTKPSSAIGWVER